ncbi:MAG: AsnC family transcriptional regulator [Candidatus Helarchaeota archaeon]|nr:AsnC family transcriptional regulator [Candidatus Helarchaeota archaeon]
MKLNELDTKNKKLIQLLQENGRNSLTDLGKQLNLSHVSVQKRLKKLVENNQVQVSANLSSTKLEICYAVVLVEVDSYEQLKSMMEKFSKCPRLVFFGTMTGAYNLIAIIAAENQDVLQSVINVCSMRNEPGLRRSEVSIIDIPLRPEFIPFKMPIGDDKELAPCGTNCKDCERLTEKKCLGCPTTKWYGL